MPLSLLSDWTRGHDYFASSVPNLSDIPAWIMDTGVTATTFLATSLPTDYCTHVNKRKLLLCGALVVAILILIAAFFISGFIQNQQSDMEVYSGDTILLVGNLNPFWYEEVVVGQIATVNTEQEVKLIKEKCNIL